ncbi:MAG: hypothetical protein SGARI_001537, partial [Bacillariaceae sp.]
RPPSEFLEEDDLDEDSLFADSDEEDDAESVVSVEKKSTSRFLKKWTPEEDAVLRKALEVEKLSLPATVRKYFSGTRTVKGCEHRWYNKLKGKSPALKPSQVTKKHKKAKFPKPMRFEDDEKKVSAWTQKEDALIIEMVEKGFFWKDVSYQLRCTCRSARTAQEVRNRYEEELDPSLHKNRKVWTEEEQKTLVTKEKEFGNNWKKIATFLPGRTELATRRFYKRNQKKLQAYGINEKETTGTASASQQASNEALESNANGERLGSVRRSSSDDYGYDI